MTDNTRGALLMMASMLAFTVNDACIKATDGALPFFQLLFLRGVLSTFLTALFNMPLANVIALLQLLPLTVTLAGAVLLREAVGWRRMVAILIGFCGMVLIVRPGSSGFNVYTLYALLAVLCVTFRDLSTRRMSAQVPSLVITFASSAGLTVVAAVISLGETWVWPDSTQTGLIILSALFIFAGYCTSVMVMRVGDLGAVTPFRYTSLLWALLLGWLMFCLLYTSDAADE